MELVKQYLTFDAYWKTQLSNFSDFNKIAKNEILELYYHLDPHGRHVSNVNGWQSHLLDLADAAWMNPLTQHIIQCSSSIIDNEFGCNYDYRFILDLWLNINFYGSANKSHNHIYEPYNTLENTPPKRLEELKKIPIIVLSGAYYVDLPENGGKFVFDSTWIGRKKIMSLENTILEIDVCDGDCLLFFPNISHTVSPNFSKNPRFVIGFNVSIFKNEIMK